MEETYTLAPLDTLDSDTVITKAFSLSELEFPCLCETVFIVIGMYVDQNLCWAFDEMMGMPSNSLCWEDRFINLCSQHKE